jgi:hypothetical protein
LEVVLLDKRDAIRFSSAIHTASAGQEKEQRAGTSVHAKLASKFLPTKK